MSRLFSDIAKAVAHQAGRAHTFALAMLIIAIWGASGVLFDWSDTWQLIINTGTTIVTFLMVFLIQNTQNRDTEAIQLKLDELVRVSKAARDEFIDMEDLPESTIEQIKAEFAHRAKTPPGAADQGKARGTAGARARRRPVP